MTRAAAPVRAGAELAPGYRVLTHLSRGNRLDVYDAWSEDRDSRVVLKTLRPDRAMEPAARRSLELEGRLLRRLGHPHLVRAYATVPASTDGRPVVVLETLAGETVGHLLHRLRDSGARLAHAEVALLGRQLCSVVGYLHRHGLLHRDIKPANIVADGGRARLIDLSLARRPGRAPAGAGTFEYLAPEQARGGTLTAGVDVWGIGAVLFSALAGRPPFGYGSGSSTTHEGTPWPQLAGRAPRLLERPELPPSLASIVDGTLEPDPQERPSVTELACALDDWLAGEGLAA